MRRDESVGASLLMSGPGRALKGTHILRVRFALQQRLAQRDGELAHEQRHLPPTERRLCTPPSAKPALGPKE
jgi:hypothetical protein